MDKSQTFAACVLPSYGLRSCRGESAGVAKRPRELISTVTIRNFLSLEGAGTDARSRKSRVIGRSAGVCAGAALPLRRAHAQLPRAVHALLPWRPAVPRSLAVRKPAAAQTLRPGAPLSLTPPPHSLSPAHTCVDAKVEKNRDFWLHARRESLVFVPRSRAILCRAVAQP
jgi:hypothetical protein